MSTPPHLFGTDLGGPGDAPLLLVGPSLGTGAAALWHGVADLVAPHLHVVGWDLPGHGVSPAATEPFTVADLAVAARALADAISPGTPVHLAGDSLGGAVTLQLTLDAPERVAAATVLCSGARIGAASAWNDRAALVRTAGTSAVVAGSAERWFGPGFLTREPATSSGLLRDLATIDDESYALACEALAGFDVVDRLDRITAPVLAIAGSDDVPTPPASLRVVADGVQQGRLEVLDGVGHLAPVEAPHEVARLLLDHLSLPATSPFSGAP